MRFDPDIPYTNEATLIIDNNDVDDNEDPYYILLVGDGLTQ